MNGKLILTASLLAALGLFVGFGASYFMSGYQNPS